MGNISKEEEFYFTFKTSSDYFKNRIIYKHNCWQGLDVKGKQIAQPLRQINHINVIRKAKNVFLFVSTTCQEIG